MFQTVGVAIPSFKPVVAVFTTGYLFRNFKRWLVYVVTDIAEYYSHSSHEYSSYIRHYVCPVTGRAVPANNLKKDF